VSPEEAEAVLGLHLEIAVAAQLADDESAFRDDWRLRYAAERIVERVFQAAQALPEPLRERHFGGDGFRALRGMRNRLAHNYLDIDDDILWESLADDLPEVGARLADDADRARRTLDALTTDETADPAAWRRSHLGPTDPSA